MQDTVDLRSPLWEIQFALLVFTFPHFSFGSSSVKNASLSRYGSPHARSPGSLNGYLIPSKYENSRCEENLPFRFPGANGAWRHSGLTFRVRKFIQSVFCFLNS